jgi:hypothetical protein
VVAVVDGEVPQVPMVALVAVALIFTMLYLQTIFQQQVEQELPDKVITALQVQEFHLLAVVAVVLAVQEAVVLLATESHTLAQLMAVVEELVPAVVVQEELVVEVHPQHNLHQELLVDQEQQTQEVVVVHQVLLPQAQLQPQLAVLVVQEL